ncbi:MAG: hypothetical protein NTZ24_14350 [Deltaproteobacteria bacterium]|nr:hypothetical protein [Deltaproteobacteria bacterium]
MRRKASSKALCLDESSISGNMNGDYLKLVFNCRQCLNRGFRSPRPGAPYFKFSPTIGASGNSPLLFVGINPRISESNRDLHQYLMADFRNFQAIAANRDGDGKYISTLTLALSIFLQGPTFMLHGQELQYQS